MTSLSALSKDVDSPGSNFIKSWHIVLSKEALIARLTKVLILRRLTSSVASTLFTIKARWVLFNAESFATVTLAHAWWAFLHCRRRLLEDVHGTLPRRWWRCHIWWYRVRGWTIGSTCPVLMSPRLRWIPCKAELTLRLNHGVLIYRRRNKLGSINSKSNILWVRDFPRMMKYPPLPLLSLCSQVLEGWLFYHHTFTFIVGLRTTRFVREHHTLVWGWWRALVGGAPSMLGVCSEEYAPSI
jgi:hypothetical protein